MLRLAALLTILALSRSATAQTEFIQVIAGLGVPGNQPALNSNLGAVGGVTVDPAGNIYLSLSNYGIVEKLDSSGILSRFAGIGTPGFSGDGGAALQAQFSAPAAIALDSAGNLYIADSGNRRVRKVAASTGIVTTIAGGGSQNDSSDGVPATALFLTQLGGLAFDATGNWYFASGCRIRKVNGTSGLTSIVVGTGVCGFGGDQGPALAAQIGNPAALALDSLGNLYFTDGNRVRAVDARSGLIETLAGTGDAGFSGDNGPASAAMLSSPSSVAVDARFNVFVADTANQRIRRIDGHSNVITTVAGTGNAGASGDGGPAVAAMLNTPKSLALDAGGNLLIADTGNGLIRRVDGSSANISTIAGSGLSNFDGDSGPAAAAQFSKLRGVAVDSVGNVYLADTGNCRIRRIGASTGTVSTVAGSGAAGPACGSFAGDNGPATEARLNAPGDVAVDSSGNLFIADTGNARIRKVDARGTITTVAGGGTDTGDGPATSAKLVSPGGVAVDSGGDVLFSDTGGNRVRMVSLGGTITTLAGNGQAGFGGDHGPATTAMLNGPAGIALDATGNLLIADNGNNRVRAVVQGTIITVAGNGQSGFGGDGGPAINAKLASPRGVAMDTAGSLWIADEANNRIRVVSSSGLINTVAGDGTPNSSGDGGNASGSKVNLPWGLATAPDQTIYFTENGSSRLRALVPLSSALGCTITAVIPPVIAVVGTGASVTIDLFSSSLACGWSVSGLPDWISAYPSSGAGSASVILRIAANSGALRTATIKLAQTTLQVNQPAASSECPFAVSPLTIASTASGGSNSFTVHTAAGCGWQVAGAPSWLSFSGPTSGSGTSTVPFTIAANTGSRRSASFTVAGQTVTVSQNGATDAVAGTYPQFASGGGWQTAFTLVNTGYGTSNGYLNFYDEKGNAIASERPGNFSDRAGDFSPLAPAELQSVASAGGSDTNPLQGWAQLLTDGTVGGYEVFRLTSGQGYLEAIALPETRSLSSYMMPFDTTGGHDYGLAVVNSTAMDGFVNVSATDATTGALLLSGSSLPLARQNHTSFVLTAQYPALANTRGVLRFSTFFAGQVNVLGLRLKPAQSITSVPVFAVSSSNVFNGFVDAGMLPQVVSGGGWSTTFVLANTGGVTSKAHLDFYDDQGAPLPLTLNAPHWFNTGAATMTGADATLLPGTMATIVAGGDQTAQSGWARLSAEGNVGAYALLSYNGGSSAREAIAPFSIPAANAYLLPFDNTSGFGTGVALANNSAQPASVLAILRDTLGQTISTETISLPAWGHRSFGIGDRYPGAANASGTLEFSSTVSGQIGLLGIRAGSNNSLAVVPALARQ